MAVRFPNCVADFAELRREQLEFVDHTGYLRVLEESDSHVVFLRPRRFGKSLWLSIMEHYYDVRFADQFAELFAGLDIFREPTKKRGQYLVLRIDFSSLRALDTRQALEADFLELVRKSLEIFLEGHRPWLSRVDEVLAKLSRDCNPMRALDTVMGEVKLSGQQVYLLIDEYDNFANALISAHQEGHYLELVQDNGLLKTFFKNLKRWAGEGAIPRTFITGINPLLLADLTSGFVASQLSMEPEFAAMLGFTAKEVAGLIGKALASAPSPSGSLPGQTEIEAMMRSWYDGYRFHYLAATLFNPDMVLHFLRALVKGRLPEELVDHSVRTDIGKLELIVEQAASPGALLELIEDDARVLGKPIRSFGLQSLADPVNFYSLLFYMGMLTYAEGPAPAMCIPNYVIRTLYWGELQRLISRTLGTATVLLRQIREALIRMMQQGDAEPFFRLLLEEVIGRASSRDFIHFNETSVKSIALAYLSLTPDIGVFSEWPSGHDFADLVLVPMPMAGYLHHAWMIELKYLSKTQDADSPRNREKKITEGRGQLTRYLADGPRRAYLSRFELHAAIALFIDGDELIWEPFEI